MKVEIITIGDELLLGQTIDTNSAYIAKVLAPLGMKVHYKVSISDNAEAIVDSLELAMGRSQLVIITGGLGPTKDDITKFTLKEFFKTVWRWDDEVYQHLNSIFQKRGRTLLDINQKQAELPGSCETLFNAKGTAPGMLFKENGTWIASLPGVPYEVEEIMQKSLIPKLRKEFNLKPILKKTLTTALIPESIIAQKLNDYEEGLGKDFGLAYLPSYNIVKIRLTAMSEHVDQSQFDHKWNELLTILGSWVQYESDESVSSRWSKLLTENNLTFGTAESCTGGFISKELVRTPGASAFFNGSIVSYSNDVKADVLNVDKGFIAQYGAVSEPVAKSMVENMCLQLGVESGVATTGIAGPSGGSTEKPVGTIFIGVKIKDEISIEKYVLRGDREEFMLRAFNTAFVQFKNLLDNTNSQR